MSAEVASAVTILLAEDDEGDQNLIKRAFARAEIRNDLHIVSDGEEALDYLLRRKAYSDPQVSPRPHLLLLDLNMPRIDGRQVLRAMRADETLRRVPVIVLTTSSDEGDVARSYDLGANSYVIKPLGIGDLSRIIEVLSAYWFQVVSLPPRSK